MTKWLATGALVLAATWAAAHEGAMGVVKERMDAMDKIGDANRSLVAIARGRADFNLETVQNAAKVLAENSGQSFLDAFPEGSTDDISEALPAIWENWDDFSELSFALESSATSLSEITSEDEFSALYRNVSKTCGGCHRKYRE